MKKLLLVLTILTAAVLPRAAYAWSSGDTTVVQTFRYDTTMRAGMFLFPTDTTKTYEKIVMLYSMRCKNGLVSTGSNTNLGCGEWDYNCYTYIIDSSMTDSIVAQAPDYTISNWSDTIYPYTNAPVYDYYRSYQQAVNYTSTISETLSAPGTGTVSLAYPLNGFFARNRTQYLWTAAELAAAGFSAGPITGIGLDLTSIGTSLTNLRIRIRATTQTALNPLNVETDGFTEVYYLNTAFAGTGFTRFNFYRNFTWNGTSGLLVEFSCENPASGSPSLVNSATTANVSGLTTYESNTYLETSGGSDEIVLPSGVGQTISNQITLAFWCYGNPSRLPANTSIFEALDASGQRQLNVHLPWSDGSIYWDCGNNGTGYDRINKAATTTEIEGRWNFWTFTKNTTTGTMRIYLNGVLWHSGTGKTKPISINRMKLCRAVADNFVYYGYFDEFSMWNAELTQTAIQELMYQQITSSHPFYSNLVVYYPLNDGSGNTLQDLSGNGLDATLQGMLWRNRSARELMRSFTPLSQRPATTFISGQYTTSVQVTPVDDSLLRAPNSVIQYGVTQNNLFPIDTNYYWQAGYSYTFDSSGVKIDSVAIQPSNIIDVNQLTYFPTRPAKVELINFITPYGINLNMNGLIGHTWAFDVTDYAPVLKGWKYMAMEDGKFQEDNDIKFVFYEGTPPRAVKSIHNIWPSANWIFPSYNDIVNNRYFEPRFFPLSANASMFKIRSAISGHGQEGEFIPRNHILRLNDSLNFARSVWTECATNPIYPQGGTWVFDRAGWCPGAAVDVREYEITNWVSPGQTAKIDYLLNPVSNPGQSNYRVNNQLVSYGPANFTLDAALDYIKTPSGRIEYARLNPVCNNPVVAIKNTGSTPLTSLTITYGRNGGTMSTYTWNGNLEFMKSAEVTLPAPAWLSSGGNEFIAVVSNPNGGNDQYSLNDTLISTFNYPAVFPQTFIVECRTNNFGGQTSYNIRDAAGNYILLKTGLVSNTIYRDTITLPTDCYTLSLNDVNDDGLSFWYNQSTAGSGYFYIRNLNNTILRNYNPDFGDNIYQQFTVNYTLPVNELPKSLIGDMEVFPNPASGFVNVDFTMPLQSEAVLTVQNLLGQVMTREQMVVSNVKERMVLDVQTLPAGVYYVVLQSNEERRTKKLVITR